MVEEAREEHVKLLTILESDIAVEGWTDTARLYSVNGTVEDPHLRKIVEAQTHPVDLMQFCYQEGIRFDERTIGLVFVTEAYRHLSLEELEERQPELVASMRQAVKALALEFDQDDTEEGIHKALNNAYNQILLRLPGPSSMPDDSRVELRMVNMKLRDGEMITGWRDRGNGGPDGEFDIKTGGEHVGRVPDAMTMFLNNVYPDPDKEVSDDAAPE